MNFLMEGKRTIKADERYENIYTVLNEKIGMSIGEIFYLCVLLGFKYRKKGENFIAGRKEFRVTYLGENQRSILYAIANESLSLVKLNTSEKINSIIHDYQLYSNGGMEILIDDVFRSHYINGHLNPNYNNYDIDLVKYIYDQLLNIPF